MSLRANPDGSLAANTDGTLTTECCCNETCSGGEEGDTWKPIYEWPDTVEINDVPDITDPDLIGCLDGLSSWDRQIPWQTVDYNAPTHEGEEFMGSTLGHTNVAVHPYCIDGLIVWRCTITLKSACFPLSASVGGFDGAKVPGSGVGPRGTYVNELSTSPYDWVSFGWPSSVTIS